jgi:hypothetical protein
MPRSCRFGRNLQHSAITSGTEKKSQTECGGRRLMRTLLRSYSLLTGKITGNFASLAGQTRLAEAVSASFWSTSGLGRQFQSEMEQGINRGASGN